jgi:hypothetical protein
VQVRLSRPLAEAQALRRAAARLIAGAALRAPLVAMTLRVTELERRGLVQWSLLEPPARGRSVERLKQAMQLVRTRFGEAGARWAREMEIPRRERVLAALLRRQTTAPRGSGGDGDGGSAAAAGGVSSGPARLTVSASTEWDGVGCWWREEPPGVPVLAERASTNCIIWLPVELECASGV